MSDLEALAKETHKFESRYLDRLIGPYPEKRDLYRERSPIHFTERLSCPVILFQGLEDKVVLPNQAEMMVEALRAKGLPVAYLPFAGEQHGFRRAENIKRSLDAELYFYATFSASPWPSRWKLSSSRTCRPCRQRQGIGPPRARRTPDRAGKAYSFDSGCPRPSRRHCAPGARRPAAARWCACHANEGGWHALLRVENPAFFRVCSKRDGVRATGTGYSGRAQWNGMGTRRRVRGCQPLPPASAGVPVRLVSSSGGWIRLQGQLPARGQVGRWILGAPAGRAPSGALQG